MVLANVNLALLEAEVELINPLYACSFMEEDVSGVSHACCQKVVDTGNSATMSLELESIILYPVASVARGLHAQFIVVVDIAIVLDEKTGARTFIEVLTTVLNWPALPVLSSARTL